MTRARAPFVLALVTLLGLPAGGHGGDPEPQARGDGLEAARAWRRSQGSAILSGFAQLLAIPNVAADAVNIRRNAERLQEELRRRGVESHLWQVAGAPPAVYGRLNAGASRTLGVYVHYDGQPVDRDAWSQPPWSPTLYTAAIEAGGTPRPLPAAGEPIDPEWRLYARSAGDDKAPLAAIFAALDALRTARIAPSSNLVFLFEGEEEAGSTHLEEHLRAHRRELAVDLWLICDGPVHPSRRPQLVFGVRGYTGLDLTVYGATRTLHSGHYGNWAPNPAQRLAGLLASMKDDQGRVTVAGFYDSVAPVTEAERRALAALPDIDDSLRRELGLAATEADDAPLAERLLLPTLNVRGLQSATVGETARNIIPAEATASLDIRLVKGNDPREMLDLLEAHIRSRGFHIVRQDPDLATRLRHPKLVRVVRRPGYPAARTAIDLPIVAEVVSAAERAAGETIILVPTLGGSLPLHLFTELLAAPVVVAPIANHDNNQHAPDENLRLANLWYGIDLMAALFTMPSPTAVGPDLPRPEPRRGAPLADRARGRYAGPRGADSLLRQSRQKPGADGSSLD